MTGSNSLLGILLHIVSLSQMVGPREPSESAKTNTLQGTEEAIS